MLETSPLPFAALMGAGFLVGVAGHLYRSPTLVAVGIGMVFLATLLIPLGVYLNDR